MSMQKESDLKLLGMYVCVCVRGDRLFEALDDVHARIGFNDARQFAHSQAERNILEWLLHLATCERAQITATL